MTYRVYRVYRENVMKKLRGENPLWSPREQPPKRGNTPMHFATMSSEQNGSSLPPAGAAAVSGSRGSAEGAWKRCLVVSCGALLLHGTWATFANWEHGLSVAYKAGLVQGLCGFGMTYANTLWMEYLLARFARLGMGLRFSLTALLTILSMLVIQVSAHLQAGTPEILSTIAPVASFGAIYNTVYSFSRSIGSRGLTAG
jgi:hypothetical protein